MRKKTQQNISAIQKEEIPFILSDDAIDFIRKYALSEMNILSKIDEDVFSNIFTFAEKCELLMMNENGEDYTYEYPEKSRNEHGCRFVTEISGKWHDNEPDYDYLNKKLNLLPSS